MNSERIKKLMRLLLMSILIVSLLMFTLENLCNGLLSFFVLICSMFKIHSGRKYLALEAMF
jgi:hypothetical protein